MDKKLDIYQLIKIGRKSVHFSSRHNHLGKTGPARIDQKYGGPWVAVEFLPPIDLFIIRAIVKKIKKGEDR